MGVGYGYQPLTGQFGPVITFDNDEEEVQDEWEYRFETDDGVIINVMVETENPARAETVRLECTEKLGWKGKPLEDEEEESGPISTSTLFWDSLFTGLIAGLLCVLITFVGLMMMDGLGMLDMDDWNIARILGLSFIGFGTLAAILNTLHMWPRLQVEEPTANAGIQR